MLTWWAILFDVVDTACGGDFRKVLSKKIWIQTTMHRSLMYLPLIV